MRFRINFKTAQAYRPVQNPGQRRRAHWQVAIKAPAAPAAQETAFRLGARANSRRSTISFFKRVLNKSKGGYAADPAPLLTARRQRAHTCPAAAQSADGFRSPNSQGASSAAPSMQALFSCPRVAGQRSRPVQRRRCAGSREARRFLVAGLLTCALSATQCLEAPWRTPSPKESRHELYYPHRPGGIF